MPSAVKARYLDQKRLGRIFGKDVSSIMYICALTPDTDNAKVGDPWQRKLSCLRSTDLVAVPAGTFHDTLKNTITFVRYPLTSQSFRTERMLAKDVGFIKETQYNGDGKITYQLELVAYKTQKGSGGRDQAPPPSPSSSAPTSPVPASVAKGYRVVDSETGLSSEVRAQYREVCSGRSTAFAAPLAKAKALRAAAPDQDRCQSLDLMIRQLTFLRAVAQGDLAIVAPGGEGIVVLGNEGIALLEQGFSDYGVILPTQGWESGLTLGARLATRAGCEAALGSAVQAGQWAGAYRHTDGLLLPGLRCGAASAPRTR